MSCHSGVYVSSIGRLVRHLQLPLPTYVIGPDGSSTPSAVELPPRTSSMYLFDEYSVEWKHFLMGLEPSKRHQAASLRRATTQIYQAIKHETCLYCWLPCPCCMCTTLWNEAQDISRRQSSVQLCAGGQRTFSSVTLILHVNELLRTTNTGHIAAFLMDGAVRVWGIDDDWLQQLGPTVLITMPDGTIRARHDVLLYPENECLLLRDYMLRSVLSPSASKIQNEAEQQQQDSSSSSSAAGVVHEMHYMLSDGTWGQAHRVNRHVPRAVARVALEIDESYESLFASLRRQTRANGVSTLEAIMLAVDVQQQSATKQRSYSSNSSPEVAAATSSVSADDDMPHPIIVSFTSIMKRFVDTVRVLKNSSVVFADAEEDEEFLAEAEQKRNRNKTFRQAEERASRERELGDDVVRQLMLPPVLSYCYCCDAFIGWTRMPEHVTGQKHRDQLAQNPDGFPSEQSKFVLGDHRLLRGQALPR